MAETVLLVMFVAAVLYAVLGGADFGAGVIEPFVPRRERVDVALAPVWEANHVWLILVVVLAFVAFPPLYAVLSTYLHLPLLLVLLGIVVRGTAFTFRHYDPAPTWSSGYTLAFRFASMLTPLFLGISVAALANGRLPNDPTGGFYDTYIAPWNTFFCWATGLFTCALFAFEGAVLLASESTWHPASLTTSEDAAERQRWRRIVRFTHLAAIFSGAVVLWAATVEATPWAAALWRSPFALAAIAIATALVAVTPWAFHRRRPWLLRLGMGAQATCILGGFAAAQAPALVQLEGGALTLAEAAAPDATLRTMLWALGFGLLIILPSVSYLIYVYKGGPSPTAPRPAPTQNSPRR